MSPSAPLVATILPPYEGFGPGQAGAIGTIVHLLSTAPGFSPLVIGGPQASATFADVPFHPVRPARWWPGNVNIRYGAALLRALRRARPALIEVHNRPELALWLARRLPRRPVLLFLHNDPQEMREAATPAERTRLLRRLARVVVVSEYLQRRLLEGISEPARAPVVLPNAIDLSVLPPPSSREPLILFAGRVVAEKAPDVFVAACSAALSGLAGWRAELIGADRFRADSPDTAFTNRVRTDAARAGVGVIGYREHAFVLHRMARAAIVVVPSRWQEPFGLVALEAMASGAALICAPRGGLREVAGDSALYVDPDDPSAVASAICSLAADPARRAAMGQAGRARAKAFDAPVIAGRLAALRREVLAGAGG
jgi:UDP-glucose:(glucosyl)LPS alpha-1,2-glucosyltransferase